MVNLATGFLVISRTAQNIFAPSWSRSTSDAIRSSLASALSREKVAWRVIVCCVVSLYPLWWWHFVCSVATILIVTVLLTLLPFQSSVVCLAWSLRLLSYQWSIPRRLQYVRHRCPSFAGSSVSVYFRDGV